MLNDATGFKKVYVAPGYTDLRKGIESLAAVIRFSFNLDPYDRNTLFIKEVVSQLCSDKIDEFGRCVVAYIFIF